MTEYPNLDTLFCSAIEIESPEERRAFLDQACAGDQELRRQVERLLRAHFHGRDILDPGVRPAVTGGETLTERAGATVGPYKLLEQVGEGGMGTVWMAQQTEPVRRLVAVKLIKAGMDSAQVISRRFGAGSTPASLRIVQTVLAASLIPRPCGVRKVGQAA